jgi:hypothetical protein
VSDFLDKAKDLAAEHGDTVKDGVDKATDVVDEKTGGKLGGMNDKIDEAAAKAIDGLAGGTP